MTAPRLVFVYNAEAGLLAGVLDSIHKAVSPATYPCSLCAITHGSFTMDRRWRDWLKALPVAPVFFHRRDFRAAYPVARDWPLPLVALDRGGCLEIILAAAALSQLGDVDALVAAIEARLTAADRPGPDIGIDMRIE